MQWPNLPEWFKVSTPHVAAVALAAAVLLFAPVSLIEKLGAVQLLASFRMWIGLVFLVSAAVIVARAFAWSWSKAAKAWTKRRNLKTWRTRLENLSAVEATILAGYVEGDTRTLYFQPSDGVIGGLAAEHVIFRSSSIGDIINGFAYNIQPWALNHLKEHPELLASADMEDARQLGQDAEAVRRGAW